MRIGDLIKFINLSYGEPEYLGIILEHHGTWAKIFWCSNFPEKIQDFSILNPDQWVVISETR